jgi:hypothetical protein
MALITAQEINYAGTTASYSAVNSSDTFVPDDRTFLHVKNTNASTRDITITTPRTGVGGVAIADITVTIAGTTGDEMIGPFPAQHFADPSTGVATVAYTATAGVTAALLRLAVPAGS